MKFRFERDNCFRRFTNTVGCDAVKTRYRVRAVDSDVPTEFVERVRVLGTISTGLNEKV